MTAPDPTRGPRLSTWPPVPRDQHERMVREAVAAERAWIVRWLKDRGEDVLATALRRGADRG